MFATLGYWICIPFAWLLRMFYNMTGSYGVAIILFTLVIKLIMLPFQMKSKKSMIRMGRMNGQLEELKKKYSNNQAKLNEEVQKMYAEAGVNPMSGCLWSFIPLPILIALYSIIRQPITRFMMIPEKTVETLLPKVAGAGIDMSAIVQMKNGVAVVKDGITQLTPYGQINLVNIINSEMPHLVENLDGWINVNYNFLGLNLTVNPWDAFKTFSFEWAIIGLILIPFIAGIFQLFQMKVTMKDQGSSAASNKGMMYMMPLMSVYIGFIMPAALGVYWIAQSVFSLIQEILMGKFYNNKLKAEEDARYEAILADRQRRIEEGRRQQELRKQEEAKKKTLKEKQKAAQEAKAAKAAKAGKSTTEAGRLGDRPYARGRAYKADRYEE